MNAHKGIKIAKTNFFWIEESRHNLGKVLGCKSFRETASHLDEWFQTSLQQLVHLMIVIVIMPVPTCEDRIKQFQFHLPGYVLHSNKNWTTLKINIHAQATDRPTCRYKSKTTSIVIKTKTALVRFVKEARASNKSLYVLEWPLTSLHNVIQTKWLHWCKY